MADIQRLCEQCGGPLGPKNRKYCSTRCQSAARRKIMKPEDLERVASMAESGYSKASIASELGVSPSTFNKRLSEDQALATAYALGQGKLSDWIDSEIRARLDDPKFNAAAKTTLLIFYAKSRAGWIDKPEMVQKDQRVQIAITLPKSLPSWEAFEAAQKPKELGSASKEITAEVVSDD